MGSMHKCVQEFKADLERKKELEKRRIEALDKIDKGRLFFIKEQEHPQFKFNGESQVKWLSKAASQLSEHTNNLLLIEKDIQEIDTTIILKLEALFTDHLLKFELPVRLDESGDQSRKQSAVFVPFATGNPDYVEITPEDLKFVILLRDKFNVRNLHMLESVSKEEYYHTGGTQS
jgi:hypothetical protein